MAAEGRGQIRSVILVGTSGWQYRDWKERFYPAGLPQRGWLEFFSRRFPTVEVNNSFYRLPTEEVFVRWKEASAPGFVVAVKASRYITHIRRLREAGDAVELFWSRTRKLGSKLGPVLFQLPPRFGADIELLRSFLRTLPSTMRAAFEFRDPSWDAPEVLEALDRAGAALVLADRSLIIRRQVEDAYPVTRKTRVTYSGSGYRDGYTQGQRADIGTTRVPGGRGRSLTRTPARSR